MRRDGYRVVRVRGGAKGWGAWPRLGGGAERAVDVGSLGKHQHKDTLDGRSINNAAAERFFSSFFFFSCRFFLQQFRRILFGFVTFLVRNRARVLFVRRSVFVQFRFEGRAGSASFTEFSFLFFFTAFQSLRNSPNTDTNQGCRNDQVSLLYLF